MFSDLIKSGQVLVQQNAPAILTGVGVAGTVTTAVLTGKATVKAVHLLEVEEMIMTERFVENSVENQDPKNWSKTDKVKLIWVQYIPPVASGVITIGAIVMAHRVSAGRIAAMAAAYSISEGRFKEYREKVAEKLGVPKNDKVQAEVAQDRVNRNPSDKEVIIVTSGEVLCFDQFSDRYFNSTVEKIMQGMNKVNNTILTQDNASLSEFYQEIGLKPSGMSDMLGWRGGDLIDVRIDTVMTDDQRPCVAIDFREPPYPEYHKTTY